MQSRSAIVTYIPKQPTATQTWHDWLRPLLGDPEEPGGSQLLTEVGLWVRGSRRESVLPDWVVSLATFRNVGSRWA